MLAAVDFGSTKLKVSMARTDLTEAFHSEFRYTDAHARPLFDADRWNKEMFLTELGELLELACRRHGFDRSAIETLCVSATAPDYGFHLSPTSSALPELSRSFSTTPQLTASALSAIQDAYPDATPWSQEFVIRARQLDTKMLNPVGPLHYHTKHSWVFSILTNEYVIDHPTASELGVAYDRVKRDWNRSVIQSELGANVRLPALKTPGFHRTRITADASALSGLRPNVIIALGACDSFCTILDAGCYEPGDVLVYYGTFFCAATTNIKGYFSNDDDFGSGFQWLFSLPFAGKTIESLICEFYQAAPDAAFAMFESEARGTPGLQVELSNDDEFPFIWDPTRFVLPSIAFDLKRASIIIGIMNCMGRNLRAKLAATAGTNSIFATGGGTQSPMWLSCVGDEALKQKLAPDRSGAMGTLILSALGASPATALPYIQSRRDRSIAV